MLTREQAIAEHRKMWNWIADSIEENQERLFICGLKRKYCLEKGLCKIKHFCFLCEFTKGNCDKCPLIWESDVTEYMCEDAKYYEDYEGIWSRCRETRDWKEQAALARQIANLPERTDV